MAAVDPQLISGENSAAALLEKIKSERTVWTGKKARVENPGYYFSAGLAGARLIIYRQININIYIQMIL